MTNTLILAIVTSSVLQIQAVTPQPDLLRLVVQEVRIEIAKDGKPVPVDGKTYGPYLRYDPDHLYIDLNSFVTRQARRFAGGMQRRELREQAGFELRT